MRPAATHVFFVLIRRLSCVLTLLFALHVVGIPDLILEMVGAGQDDCCHSCEDAPLGKKCPPLCPNCACSHAVQLSMPLGGASVPPAEASPSKPRGVAMHAHVDPHLEDVFRPPRA
jgi:hypothetical protein